MDEKHMRHTITARKAIGFLLLLLLGASVALAESQPDVEATTPQSNALADPQTDAEAASPRSNSTIAPDIRGSDHPLKVEKGNLVVVPIPNSSPELGSGLILGAGYFHKQSAAQKKVQPASVTGVAAYYTSNGSYAGGIGNESYWDKDNWRFTGAIGYANLDLELLTVDVSGSSLKADWLIDGEFVYAKIARKFYDHWYAGIFSRYVAFDQDLTISGSGNFPGFDFGNSVQSVGLGLQVQYDSRDMPTNPYNGKLFTVNALFNEKSLGSDKTYQSYDLTYSSYHELSAPVVIAWEVSGCLKSGTVPLWDACRIGLRGFPGTNYMGESTEFAQIEARWKFSKKWGIVGFVGVGHISNYITEGILDDVVPSYGVGLRFMVMQAKRINMPLDYGRSRSSDTIYLSVGEAF
jgi:hypothetical protein